MSGGTSPGVVPARSNRHRIGKPARFGDHGPAVRRRHGSAATVSTPYERLSLARGAAISTPMSRILAVALLAVFGVVMGPRTSSAAEAVTLDRVVAVVNDDVILDSELRRAIELDPTVAVELQQLGTSATPQQRALKQKELRARVLDALIEHRLIMAEAPRFQLTATDSDVEAYLQNLAQRNGMASVDELRKAVDDSGQFGSWAEYRQKLREDIVVYKVQNVLAAPVVTDAQVRERYRKMSRGEEAKVEVIMNCFETCTSYMK